MHCNIIGVLRFLQALHRVFARHNSILTINPLPLRVVRLYNRNYK